QFLPQPIESSYLIQLANFLACHQDNVLDRLDVLAAAARAATLLLYSTYGREEVWDHLPIETQRAIVEKELRFYVIDAQRIADEVGLGTRINTILQTCFFALAGVLDREEAIARIKHAIEKSYGKRGQAVLEMNYAAVDRALAELHEVPV